MSDGHAVSPLQAGHDHLLERYHHAGSDRGDGMAVDWAEREILAPLVDVADMLRRIADHGDSAHYRAEKAGALLHAAAHANLRAVLAYAGRPDDDTPEHEAITAASEMLGEMITKIRGVMWVEARGDEHGGEQHDKRDTADLLFLADRFAAWARSVDERAVDYPDDE